MPVRLTKAGVYRYALYALQIAGLVLAWIFAYIAPIPFAALVVIVVIVYAIALIYDAKTAVAQFPRKEMFLCDKHGPLPIGATMTLFDGDEMESVSEDGRTKRGPIRCCPICFNDSVKAAKKNVNH